MKRKVIKPNVVSGGVAIPLGDNMYLMRGRKHKNGGIDIGNDPKTGIEVEDGEVMQMTNKGAKIFSAMPLLRGSSPANEVLSGANPNDVFRRQEAYKDRNGINDDGSKKKAIGGGIPPYKNKYKQQPPYTPTLNLTNDQMYELQKNVLGENNARYKKEVKKITNKVVDKTKPTRTITDTQYDNRKNIIKDYNDQHKEKAYRSKKDMQFNYDVHNSDKKQVKWIADWYNGRREQLYNNLVNYNDNFIYPTRLNQYERDNTGEIIKEEIPFSRIFNKKESIDKEYNRLIENSASANLDNSLMYYANPYASGAYSKPIKYSNKNKYYNHTVGYTNDATNDVRVHERTHAANPVAQIKEVERIPSIDNKDYTKSAKEVYSRLMQYRYKYNLNPKDKIDDAYLNNHRKELEDLDLNFMSDDELKFLFNEVAENKNNKSNKIRPMAKYGGFSKYAGGGNYKGSWGNLYPSRYFTNSWSNLTSGDEYKGTWGNLYPQVSKDPGYYVRRDTLYKEDDKNNIFSKFFKNKDNVSDLIGVGSNILGSTLSYFRNKSMLKNMQAPIKPTIAAPVSYQQTKLKTNVNINPQLDTLRNSSAIYNNSVDNNTASSRVALARKQVNRMNINNQINSLYGNKENQETELINKDRMQQQQTANQNVAQYNDYLNRKAALDNEYNNQLINFKNTINEKKAENAVSLFSNANAAIQDILGRREQRTNERNTIAAYLASHPDVNPRIFERLGINGVFTPEMIEAWEEEYKNNKKKK